LQAVDSTAMANEPNPAANQAQQPQPQPQAKPAELRPWQQPRNLARFKEAALEWLQQKDRELLAGLLLREEGAKLLEAHLDVLAVRWQTVIARQVGRGEESAKAMREAQSEILPPEEATSNLLDPHRSKALADSLGLFLEKRRKR
jgi:hypothetical protein